MNDFSHCSEGQTSTLSRCNLLCAFRPERRLNDFPQIKQRYVSQCFVALWSLSSLLVSKDCERVLHMYSLCRFKCLLSVAFVLNAFEQIPHSFKSVSFSGDENAVKVLNSLTYSEYEKSE